ncbi:signal recognition particle-docking protein FtsY [Companilactobacillus futsaii]|uniref:Signal recognition particle receptor FtsY n=2 Tax=Companilactobacillus futsaii TaxID=938155 RepID=A0A5B7T2X8_9LACO|nr:signal recognition particle-docking protein FtsY [Companilactobacillus futsaii]KRK91462.1 Signal recognition particle-docking protein FtsY [Companilactobacillus futsaii JCM 17355]QCX24501.1 signal recognition particle-docking protein FtsY [Companilactobacillus futsaii]
MGLFDRIKKAFTGKDDSEEKEPEKKASEQAPESDQKSTPEPASPEEKEESATEAQPQENAETKPAKEEKTKQPIEPNTEEANPEPESKSKLDQTSEESIKEEKTVEPQEEAFEADKKTEAETEQPVAQESEETKEPEESEEPKDDVKEYDEGLKKSRNSFSSKLNHFLANFRSVDEDFFDDLEELLIESDVGYETAMRISDELREEVKLENAKKKSDVSNVIVRKLVDMYGEEGKNEDNNLKFSTDKTPTIFLFVGVNGAGKTTTIGKLAHRYQSEGKKVLLAAGDTFRAGAIEQLQEWGKRVNVPVQASKAHTDPASVVYDAVQRAINEDFDILLVDTAGRLQNKEGLMRELEKIKRVITRELPEAPQEVLLVLDGSTGQNALSQAKQFNETTEVSGIVLTKLDGSSQGGVVLAIRNELHIPVKLVGLGEQMDDLRDFDPEKFIYGLFKDLIVGTSNK